MGSLKEIYLLFNDAMFRVTLSELDNAIHRKKTSDEASFTCPVEMASSWDDNNINTITSRSVHELNLVDSKASSR